MNEGTIVYRPFLSILYDAVSFALLAEAHENDETDPPHSYESFSFARASVLNSVFALECAANVCLSQTAAPANIKKRLEYSPTIDKYDFLLFIRNPDAKISRGAHIVQMLEEIIALRNAYIHPKTKEQEAIVLNASPDGGEFQKVQDLSQHLNISKTMERCYSTDAENAIKVVTTFLRWYFIDLSKMSFKQAQHFLLSLVFLKGSLAGFIEEPHRKMLEQGRQKWQLPIDFLLDLS